jgi:hypothetical protein
MINPESIAIILSGIGNTAPVAYYARYLWLANTTQLLQLETRQVQLSLDIAEATASPEFQRLFYRVADIDEWDDLPGNFARHGPESNLDMYAEHVFIWQRFDSLGLLLMRGVIDLDFM